MHLTPEDQDLLEGKAGRAARKAMEILVALGTIYGAERMVPRVGAPGVLLRLSVEYCAQQIAIYGGHRELSGTMRSLYPLGFSAEEEVGILGRLRALG